MPNFPGQIAYPYLVDRTPFVDAGAWTKAYEVSIARGGTTADYNVKLRGAEPRIDFVPVRPYP